MRQLAEIRDSATADSQVEARLVRQHIMISAKFVKSRKSDKKLSVISYCSQHGAATARARPQDGGLTKRTL